MTRPSECKAIPNDEDSVQDILDSDWFQPEVSKTLNYVSGFVVSKVVFQLLKLGIFESLRAGMALDKISTAKSLDADLLRTVFEYLVIEDILIKDIHNDRVEFRLSEYGSRIHLYEGWFNIFIGGYENIFSNIDNMMENGIGHVKRDGKWVGIGSCQISKYDTIPKTKEFITRIKPHARTIVDFGCGNALYLCTLVKELDGIQAIGIEPDKNAYEAGLAKIEELGLADQIHLENIQALNYDLEGQPDFILFGFVLHEIVSQIGRAETIDYLKTFGRKFKESYLIVMEVDYNIDNHDMMKSEIGKGYYNPYFLLHPFTNQQLLPKKSWDEIFNEAGYEIVINETTSLKADPSGFGICYVLKHRGI